MLFWTHIQGFHLLFVIEIIWTKRNHDLPKDANKCLRAAAHWLPLGGQLEPRCSLRKCLTPHVVCVVHFTGRSQQWITPRRTLQMNVNSSPKPPLIWISLSQGFLFSWRKSTGLFWSPLQYASFGMFSCLWQHTKQSNTSTALSCSNSPFQVKGPLGSGMCLPWVPHTQLSLIRSSTHPSSHGLLLKGCDWCHCDARRCYSITDRCQLLSNAVQTF